MNNRFWVKVTLTINEFSVVKVQLTAKVINGAIFECWPLDVATYELQHWP